MYGFPYENDITINASDKDHNHYSKEFNCELPYAVKLDGTRGIYLHEDVTTGDLSHKNSHGCINLLPGEAESVYNWIKGRTRIVISYNW